MSVVSTALDEPARSQPPVALPYGTPVSFNGCSGFLHPAGGSVGIVFCSPWGFEDLTMRKSWRLLAEAVADAGYPCLRFDYPGTGDSLGTPADIKSCDPWIDAIHKAADFLRSKTGVKTFVFLGQSLGAALALAAARGRTDVAGLQLIAPIVKGRAYVRELAVTASLVSQRIGVAHEASRDEALSIVGFPVSQALVDSLKTLDLATLDKLEGLEITIFDQADRKAGAELFEHCRKSGAAVRMETVAPYHLMISDAITIQPLPVAPEAVLQALRRSHPVVRHAMSNAPSYPSMLVANHFREEPIRFGAEKDLFGVLCSPAQGRVGGPAFILLNRGLNSHVGWRRVSVDQARALASAGIASLRIDAAGLGESRDAPGRPAALIYSDMLLPDIAAAVDALAARGHCRIALAGVCSGAYMALLAARLDARVTDVFAVNPQRLVWNPTEDPDELIRYGLRSMNDYVGDIRSGFALRKLIRSRKRVVPAMRFLLARRIKNAMARVPLAWRAVLLPGSMAARVDAAFRSLAERGTRVALVFTESDPGLAELGNFYGPDGRDMGHSNVSITMIADADHNLTSTRASALMLDHMLAFAAAAPPRAEAASVAGPRRGHQQTVCPT